VTEEEWRKLVLQRFGVLAELVRHVRRLDRAFRRAKRHPDRVIERDTDELDDLDQLFNDDEEEED